jgi:glycosyltransferase involved in cell wall biosynthesis
LHILVVISYYKPAYIYGGPAHSVPAICEGLARAGAQVTVFTTDANGSQRLAVPLNTPINVNGVTVWYFPLAAGGVNFYSPKLGAAIRRQASDFDLILAEAIWEYALQAVAWANKRFKIPFIVPVRGQLFPWALRQKYLKKSIYLSLFARRYLHQAVAFQVSDATEAEAVGALGFRIPTFVIPNGVDLTEYRNMPASGEFRARYGILANSKIMLFLGRLTPIKRPDLAIRALSFVRGKGVDACLVIAGPDEGRMRTDLMNLADQLECGNNVLITGLLDENQTHQVLADADLFLMPSQVQESFGMAAVEAMAAGVPILVSEGVPVGRMAEISGAGKVVACEEQEFNRTSYELLSNSKLRAEMGARGRALAYDHFEISMVARQALLQYQSIQATGFPISE